MESERRADKGKKPRHSTGSRSKSKKKRQEEVNNLADEEEFTHKSAALAKKRFMKKISKNMLEAPRPPSYS